MRPAAGRQRRLLATLALAALATGACGSPAPTQTPQAEVPGGAVGPDVRVSEDVDLQQVQLEYPLDGRYEPGEDARLFMAITNTGSDPVSLAQISGPDFADVRVESEVAGGLPLLIDGNDTLYIGAEGPPDVVLLGLERELHSSQSIPVTFTFQDAGEVTVDVPVSAEGQSPGPTYDFPSDGTDQDPTG